MRVSPIIVLFLLSAVLCGQASAQNKFVDFKHASRLLDVKIEPSDDISLREAHCWDGSCYRWLQFEQIPTSSERAEMEVAGVIFLEYVRHHCYLVALPEGMSLARLYAWGARALEVPDERTKMAPRILSDDIPDYNMVKGLIEVKLMVMPGVERSFVARQLADMGVSQVTMPNHDRFIFMSADRQMLMDISVQPWARYIDLMDPDGEPESVEGRSLQRANLIHNHLTGPDALRFDGEGVGVLVRDDGDVGPHIDFQGRLWNDPDNTSVGTHGDGVAGVWAAAGNLDPTVVAAAPGADVYAIDYLSTFLDNTLPLHTDSGVVITNSSFSNGCNVGYTSTTVTVDAMAHDYPTLMHVFSAGNSNNQDCGYGAGSQWGNITGGHKQGKNVIAVANLFRDGSLVSSSSRGPAHDGRIKPDLAGHGQGQMSTDPNNQYGPFGGTSAAAPSTAGNLAQLYHAYRSLYGSTPEAALIKACAMNSAIDLGQPGPDYSYGWGLVHGGRAYEMLENGQFISDVISSAPSMTHNISVPSGTAELRVMLYWNDPEASSSASVALVNDLDLTVSSPQGGLFDPRVLDPSPNPATLAAPASTTNGPDRLNNVEQVAITNPSAGSYTVNVLRHALPQGPQPYFIVYTFIRDELKVTYPLGGERLVPGVRERIHWDAYGDQGSFVVEFSEDGGATWSNIATVGGGSRSVDWTPSSTVSGACLVRVSRAGLSDESDEFFSLHPVVQNLQMNLFAIDSATLSWTAPSAGVTSYDIYRLGDQYMELMSSTTETFLDIGGLSNGEELWLSVAANTNNALGQRAVALYHLQDAMGSCSGCIFETTLPVVAHFEQGLDGHCNDASADDMDWVVNQGETPSASTGPGDGYTGAGYLYIEASGDNHPFKTGILGSECIDLSSTNAAYMQFDYHMFGSDMGSLTLELSTDGGMTWPLSVWSVTGDQGNAWQQAELDLSPWVGGSLAYRFVAVTGQDFRSDIAIDNIRLDSGPVCGRPLEVTADTLAGGTGGEVLVFASAQGNYRVDLLAHPLDGRPFDGMPTHEDVDSLVVIDLPPSMSYVIYARKRCGDARSAWVRGDTVTTRCLSLGNVATMAIPIPPVSVYYDTMDTRDACLDNQLTNFNQSSDVYYQFTTGATVDTMLITTCNALTAFDTYLVLLDSALSVVALNDDIGSNCNNPRASEIVFVPDPWTTYYVVVEGWSSSEGLYALEVAGLSDCPVQRTVSGAPVSGSYTAGSIISDAIIQSPRQVIFSASDEINLLPDFEVETGAQFETTDGGCP